VPVLLRDTLGHRATTQSVETHCEYVSTETVPKLKAAVSRAKSCD